MKFLRKKYKNTIGVSAGVTYKQSFKLGDPSFELEILQLSLEDFSSQKIGWDHCMMKYTN